MGHAELVFNDEQTMEEGLRFTIHGPADRILDGPGALSRTAEAVVWVMPPGLPQRIGREELSPMLNRHQAIPIPVVADEKFLERSGLEGRFIPPGIPGEDLIASGPGEHHFDEATRQPGRVIVRIAHPHPQILDSPNDAWQGPFEVTG